jgi:thymidylate kinase
MRIVPLEIWNSGRPTAIPRNGLIGRSENPMLAKVMAARRSLLQSSQDESVFQLERFAREARVIIVEGISGSGKDTFQTFLKKRLKDRVVYDYSEGEVLHSWKQLQIEGIPTLRVQLLKLFVNYINQMISKDDNAVFLLNRFHLSTYASTIVQNPKLEVEYNDIVKVLKTISVHIFILKLDENEIEKRSSHPERSTAWLKFQQQIIGNHSFRDRLELQQSLILQAAKKQQIPYSLIKLADDPETVDVQGRKSRAPSISLRGARLNSEVTLSTSKNHATPNLYK